MSRLVNFSITRSLLANFPGILSTCSLSMILTALILQVQLSLPGGGCVAGKKHNGPNIWEGDRMEQFAVCPKHQPSSQIQVTYMDGGRDSLNIAFGFASPPRLG